MEIWNQLIEKSRVSSQASALLASEKCVFADIETTGLSPKYHHCYLIGCCFLQENDIILRQFFCESAAEEKEMLFHFCDFISSFDQLITFNGRHFDLPFLEKRCLFHQLQPSFSGIRHLDIYRECQPMKKALGLLSCRQKAIEKFLGIHRDDRYDGGELIPVYDSYGKDHDPEKLALLKLHNFEDVLGMTALLPILAYKQIPDQVQVTQVDTDSLPADTSFAAVQNPQVIIHGTIGVCLPRPLRLHRDNCYCILEENTFRLSLTLTGGPMKYFIRDYKKYDYLTEEKRIVPKTLSRYVDTSRKVPATAATCYLEQNGFFLSLPKNLPLPGDVHLFRQTFDEKQSFLLWDSYVSDKNFLKEYITVFLRSFL